MRKIGQEVILWILAIVAIVAFIIFIKGKVDDKFISRDDRGPDFISTSQPSRDTEQRSSVEEVKEAIRNKEFVIHSKGIVEYGGWLCCLQNNEWMCVPVFNERR